MKTLICYFSGTGNTKKVSEEFARRLGELGVETSLCNIEKQSGRQFDTDGIDAIGIAYPIWAFNAPKIVLDFAKALKKRETPMRAFVIKTSGEPVRLSDASSCKLRKILKSRGYTITNEYHYVMPYNIIFRHTDGMAYKMWQTALKTIPIDCREFAGGKEALLKPVLFGGLVTAALRIQQWGGRFNGKRYKVDEKKCIRCNLCVDNCPTKNISVKDGKFVFGKNCLMCMRCAFECPKAAIKIGLFEKWKVNGRYTFAPPVLPEKPNGHENYCRKAYERYFARCEQKQKENAE